MDRAETLVVLLLRGAEGAVGEDGASTEPEGAWTSACGHPFHGWLCGAQRHAGKDLPESASQGPGQRPLHEPQPEEAEGRRPRAWPLVLTRL